MCSDRGPWLPAAALILAAALVLQGSLLAQGGRATPKFYPDDPIALDDDGAFDAGGAAEHALAETFDFLENTFGEPGDRTPNPAVNVNTLGEVPDSSWFTNRIGARDMPISEILRGPNKFERLEADAWTIVAGKSPGGFHPGFRAVHPGDPQQIYQLEVDPPDYPQMATGAEMIGTLLYHALGYHVVDMYLVRVHPTRITIAPDATIRDASGRRRFTRHDLDAVLREAARDSEGRVYFSASRFEEGTNLGHFRYYGTRPDDPNDVHPHEHRRELRANRVFSAWLAHDDSRAVNTLDMLVEENGRRFIRHYMYDFGAILGSATRFPDPASSGHEYFIEKEASLVALATLGFHVPPYARAPMPDMPPSAGFVSSVAFEPDAWRPNYPNPAFRNMRPDDAFWGARLVSKFTDEIIAAIVGAAGYDDPRATAYLTRTIAERRDKVLQTWLVGVNPIVDVRLAADGTLTFVNAALMAGAASAPDAYIVSWSRFDNDTGVHTAVGEATRSASPRVTAPSKVMEGSSFVAASIRTEHPQHAVWNTPVQVYFRRTADGWQTVGLLRE